MLVSLLRQAAQHVIPGATVVVLSLWDVLGRAAWADYVPTASEAGPPCLHVLPWACC